MLGEPEIGPNIVQKPFVRPAQSFKRWRKRLVAWILHLSATDPRKGSVATLQVPRDRLAGCSSRPLRSADYSSGANFEPEGHAHAPSVLGETVTRTCFPGNEQEFVTYQSHQRSGFSPH